MPSLLERVAAEAKSGLSINRITEVDVSGPSPFYITSSSSSSGLKETVDASFLGYVEGIYKSNGIVAACMAARAHPFSEARFQYQEIVNGRPGRLFPGNGLDLLSAGLGTDPSLGPGVLLSRMIQDVDLAGNFYATTTTSGKKRIRRMRPDHITILSGVAGDSTASPLDINAEIILYIYDPNDGSTPVLLTPDRVVHWAPDPDPEAQWRGMSWITPIIKEIQADNYITTHKEQFFKKGATLGTVITYDPKITTAQFEHYVSLFEQNHRGAANAYKTLHLGGGASAQTVGSDMRDLDFKAVQGAGETRIAAAAGVGAIIARFSEGLAGSALNAGNYSAAKRQYADMTLRPLWRTACGALSKFTSPPTDSRLWYDVRDVSFLQEDAKDAAEILSTNAQTVSSLVMAGYTPESVLIAVQADDLSRLVHSGYYSVQLQVPGADASTPAPPPAGAVETLPKPPGRLDPPPKSGARNSRSDLALIQSAHDAITAAGATCPAEEAE